ncbi:MAG: SUF system NifU family Fe-S cluster assembly protein [SAR202 cluster bacterium]|nr:SUF system NifU family Fe-S cluster assembly protein [SAR202 cluster bacterium]|tara:strand:- start:1923 stop:2363 length:441 start_codon:yes stop_codon:yes gene_type:complete
MELEELYRDIILDHNRTPRNKRQLDDADIANHQKNPVCGDEINIQIVLDGDQIDVAFFFGQGCSISQASASILTDVLKGKTLDQARAIAAGFHELMNGSEPNNIDDLGDLVALQGVAHYPVRIKCAVLACDTLDEGVIDWLNKHQI